MFVDHVQSTQESNKPKLGALLGDMFGFKDGPVVKDGCALELG
jgi:hypothetical protein